MENSNEILEFVRENAYDNELADIYIRDQLDENKKYD